MTSKEETNRQKYNQTNSQQINRQKDGHTVQKRKSVIVEIVFTYKNDNKMSQNMCEGQKRSEYLLLITIHRWTSKTFRIYQTF